MTDMRNLKADSATALEGENGSDSISAFATTKKDARVPLANF